MSFNLPKTKFLKKFLNIDHRDSPAYYGLFNWDSSRKLYLYGGCNRSYINTKADFVRNRTPLEWGGPIIITKTGWCFKDHPDKIYPWAT